MPKTLLTLAIWGALGGLVGSLWRPDLGWAVVALGLALMVLVSGVQLSRIRQWVADIDSPPPASVGPWNELLAPIYRALKRQRNDIEQLNAHIDAIMMAAEALPDGAITLDEDMNLTWCNQTAAEHVGLNLNTDRGLSVFNILRDPLFVDYARHPPWNGPILLHLNHDGNERAVLAQLTRYGLGQFLLVTRDVTQMEKLETTRKDFVANVSHELRTPLTVLAGFLETLRDIPREAIEEQQRLKYLDMMLEQAQRMQAIVADLLTLSTLESSPTAGGDTVAMPEIIRKAFEQGKILSNGQHVFLTDVDEELRLNGVDTELSSAVTNLITNAIRYTPKDGTITISWFANDAGQACFSVQDTGIGVAAQDIPRLTERFYRVDRGRSRATGGTGLGLAITKHVAMRHGAELTIKSRIGAGSRFSLVFPASRVVREVAGAGSSHGT